MTDSLTYRFMFSRPGTTPCFSEGLEAFALGFSAFGLRISRFDFFCDLATSLSFDMHLWGVRYSAFQACLLDMTDALPLTTLPATSASDQRQANQMNFIVKK